MKTCNRHCENGSTWPSGGPRLGNYRKPYQYIHTVFFSTAFLADYRVEESSLGMILDWELTNIKVAISTD